MGGEIVLCINNCLGRCQKYWQTIGGFDIIFIVRRTWPIMVGLYYV